MRITLTIALAALLVGCSAGGKSGEELRDGAFSLVLTKRCRQQPHRDCADAVMVE
jgi:hypothetical protein